MYGSLLLGFALQYEYYALTHAFGYGV